MAFLTFAKAKVVAPPIVPREQVTIVSAPRAVFWHCKISCDFNNCGSLVTSPTSDDSWGKSLLTSMTRKALMTSQAMTHWHKLFPQKS